MPCPPSRSSSPLAVGHSPAQHSVPSASPHGANCVLANRETLEEQIEGPVSTQIKEKLKKKAFMNLSHFFKKKIPFREFVGDFFERSNSKA